MESTDPRIFISYRRNDTAPYAGWLHDNLAIQFGTPNIFKDVDSIQAGADFPRIIGQAVAACDVLLALIGPAWLEPDQANLPRVHNPDDWVRLEIESALDHGVIVIPLLIQDAEMPTPQSLPPSLHRLLHKNALRLDHKTFREDVRRIVEAIRTPQGIKFIDNQAIRTERSRISRFATIQQLYRDKVESLLGPLDQYDYAMKATYRRPELDRLVDVLDFDEDVVHLALGVLEDPNDPISGWRPADWTSGLIALTPRCLIYVPHSSGRQVQRVPYSQILSADISNMRSKITLTLPDRNVKIVSIRPKSSPTDLLNYMHDRLPKRQ